MSPFVSFYGWVTLNFKADRHHSLQKKHCKVTESYNKTQNQIFVV